MAEEYATRKDLQDFREENGGRFDRAYTSAKQRAEAIDENAKKQFAELNKRFDRLREWYEGRMAESDKRYDEKLKEFRDARAADRRQILSVLVGSFAILVWIINSSVAPVGVKVGSVQDRLQEHMAEPAHTATVQSQADIQGRVEIIEKFVFGNVSVAHGNGSNGTAAELNQLRSTLENLLDRIDTQEERINAAIRQQAVLEERTNP